MSGNPNKLSRFWQELKRRKVIRISAMYAATAFIIIEAADIVLPRLGLPDWTVTFLIILLIAGFPIAIILSWIFDVTPEGIQRTETIDKMPEANEKMPEAEASPAVKKRRLRVSDGVIAVLLAVVVILVYPKIFKPDREEYFNSQGEVSVAVMPFRNLTGDSARNFWQVMVQDNLITSLSNLEELEIRQTESTITLLRNSDHKNYGSITPAVASNISKKLEADVFVHGSINQIGGRIRLNAKLVDSETEEIFQSFQIEGTEEDIFDLTDSLSRNLKDFLVISVLKKEMTPEFQKYLGTTNSAEAVRYYIQGKEAFYSSDYALAREFFYRAIEIDSIFPHATGYLALTYINQGRYEDAGQWCRIAYENRERVNRRTQYLIEWLYANYFGTPSEALIPLRKLLKMDDHQAFIHFLSGVAYMELYQYDRAISELENSMEIYDQWGIKPPWVFIYTNLGKAYHETGKYKRERRIYRRAEKNFPGDRMMLYRQAVLALSRRNSHAADEYMEKYVSVLEDNAYSEGGIASNLGRIYEEAGLLDKAEEYYRRALSLEPDSPYRLNILAYFLIDRDRNIPEGLDLIKKALESDPDHYQYLDTRGWGLYKQENFREALELAERSWELKPVYDHDIYLHLEAIKKALSADTL